MEIFWTVYFSTVGIAGIYIILRIRKFIDRLEMYRKKSLQRVQEFSPIPTDFPDGVENKSVRAAGIESIETRFSMIRRILAPFILLFWACLIFIPLFPTIPAVFASILAAFITGLIAITTRPIFENAVAGMVVSFSQPVRIGDTVKIDGHYGTIEEITITHTKMKVWDWQRYIIPNRSLLEKEFINYSIVDEYIWAYVEFWVSYDVDMEMLESLSLEAAKKSRYLLDCEDPAFWVMGLRENSICCWLAGWAATPGDAWELKTSIRKELIKSFQKHNIHTHLQNINIQQQYQGGKTAPH